MIADYERSNFSVSQCLFRDDNPQDLVAILSPLIKIDKPGLKTATLVAIIVSIVVAILLIISGLFILIRVCRKRQEQLALADSSSGQERATEEHWTAETLHENQVYEVSNVKPVEMCAVEIVPKMVGRERDLAHELVTRERLIELSSEVHERR